MDEAEKAGSEGNVNLAQSVVEEADKLREESALLEVNNNNNNNNANSYQCRLAALRTPTV